MALQDKLRHIDDLKKQLDGLLPMPVEQQQKLDEKLRLEFHYNTNHIEGNTLTYGETKLAILFDQVSEGHSLREFEEMKASDVAYKYVQGLAKDNDRPLTEAFIKELNQILLVREYYKEALTPDGQETRRLISIGDYKKHPNSVRLENGELFHYATPAETPAMMTDMVSWYREEEEKKEHHTVLLAALLHYRFVRIHPFDDGNGRVSRLLMNYVLFKNGFPPVVIKSEDKPNYLRALNRADAGDEGAFIEYIADQLIWSLKLSIKAAKGEDIEEQQDWKKKLAVLDRELSSGEKVQVIKSTQTINTIIKDAFYITDRVLQELHSIFDNYFVKVNIVYDSDVHGFGSSFVALKTGKVDENFNALEGYRTYYENGIHFLIHLYGFKKNGINSFDVHTDMFILFDKVGFRFQTEGKEIATELYSDSNKDMDLTLIINVISKNIVQKMEQEIAKTKST